MAAYRRVYDLHHLQADCQEHLFASELKMPTEPDKYFKTVFLSG